MNAKHTPGPWVEGSRGDYKWIESRGVRICVIDTEADNAGLSFDESEANAALIKAAPDLFHSVQQLMSIAFLAALDNPEFQPAVDAASAAIAKATGGQS